MTRVYRDVFVHASWVSLVVLAPSPGVLWWWWPLSSPHHCLSSFPSHHSLSSLSLGTRLLIVAVFSLLLSIVVFPVVLIPVSVIVRDASSL